MMKFRNDISFLRAISVIAVLLYHFKFSFFKGGFIGVDIFFVISGFLMTKIILDGFENENFNLLDFYKKRLIRIFPALLVMISFFAIIIYFFIPPQFATYLKSFFSSSLFFSNIYYYLHSGYFDPGSQFNFLLHTWSLSVEWQFYMIYPLLLMLFRRTYINNIKSFYLIFFSLITASFLSMIFNSKNDESYSFFIFYPRAWEMMFGGIAFIFSYRFKKFNESLKKYITIISIITLLSFIIVIDSKKTIWPSLITLIPVAATTSILLVNSEIKIFRNKFVTFFGNISYSLYLWHWPFYVLSMFFAMNERLRYRILFILLSFIFAMFSYYFVEKRNYKNKSMHIVFISLLLFSFSYCYSITHKDYIDTIEAKNQYGLDGKYFRANQKLSDFKFPTIEKNKKYIVLLGDSHAGMFSKTISEISKESKLGFIQITTDGTYPMINANGPSKNANDFFNYFFTIYFPSIKNNVEFVIINSYYNGYTEKEIIEKINFTNSYFAKNNTKLFYLGVTPNFPIDYPSYEFIKEKYNIIPIREDAFKNKVYNLNEKLREKLGKKYIDLQSNKIYPISNGGTPYIYDLHHLTYFGTQQHKKTIKLAITESL